jgi:hypothetical protein
MLTMALLVAGCGGSSKSSRTTPSSNASHSASQAPAGPDAQLIAKTNAACARIAAKFASVHATSFAVVAHAAVGISTYEKQAIDELRHLKPSSAVASTWSTILDSLTTLANKTAKLAAYANDPKGATKTLAEISKARLRILTASRQTGFVGCQQIAV